MGTGLWRRTSVRVLGVSVLVAVVAGVLTFFVARPARTDATVVGEGTTAGSSTTPPADARAATTPGPTTRAQTTPATTVLATTPSATTVASGETPLFVISPGGNTIEPFSGRRPADIEFTRHVPDFVIKISWDSWGPTRAVGHGEVLNEQMQFDPKEDEQRATVVFSDPIEGKFTRAVVSVPTRPDAVYVYGSGRWPLKARPEAAG